MSEVPEGISERILLKKTTREMSKGSCGNSRSSTAESQKEFLDNFQNKFLEVFEEKYKKKFSDEY